VHQRGQIQHTPVHGLAPSQTPGQSPDPPNMPPVVRPFFFQVPTNPSFRSIQQWI
jgi:hypothetical protein